MFSRIRNIKTPHLRDVGHMKNEEWVKSREQGPKIKSLRAMFFPPNTAPEKILRNIHAAYPSEPQLTEAVRARDEKEAHAAASSSRSGVYGNGLEHKADMNDELFIQGDNGYIPCTVLHITVGREDVDIVELLLQHGARVDESIMEEGVFKANETIFQALLDHGADLSHRYSREETILDTAAAKGFSGILNKLIKHGADIDAIDAHGNTPLHVAAVYNHRTIVQLLLDAGTNIQAIDHQNLTALAIAIKTKGTAVIRTLLDNNANMKAYDEAPPALILAAIQKDESSIRLLLELGADPNAYFLVTPLHIAAADDYPELLELLLSYGANVESRITCHDSLPQPCQTPLHFAVNYGHISAAKVLLERGTDVNGTYHDGMTPLHLAAQMGHLDMASFLLLHGADITAETEKTDTPFSIAIASDHGNIAEMLSKMAMLLCPPTKRPEDW